MAGLWRNEKTPDRRISDTLMEEGGRKWKIGE